MESWIPDICPVPDKSDQVSILMEFTQIAGIETFGKNAVVCGRSKNVGMPIAMLLHSDGIGETEACEWLPALAHAL